MRSGRRLGGILGLSRQRECSESALGHHFGHFGSHFGGQFRLKSDLFRHRFLHQISEGIFRGFWWILEVIFMTFWLQTGSESEKAKRWKTYVLHKENLCFGGSRALYFHQQSIKNDVGTRGGIGTDFFMIFDGFRPPFRGPKSRKNDKKRCRKRTRIRTRKKSEKRTKRSIGEVDRGRAGGRGGGARGLNSERIRRSGQEPTC